MLYLRTSRSVTDKIELGWRYPCGRPISRGTGQVSPNERVYLPFPLHLAITIGYMGLLQKR